MREMQRRTMLVAVILILLFPIKTAAAETGMAGEDYLESWREELDFSELDELLETELFQNEREPIRFSSVVDALLIDGFTEFDYTMVLAWVKEVLFYELDANRRILIEVVVLVVAFSAIKNF